MACSKSMCTALVLIQAVCTTLAIKKNIFLKIEMVLGCDNTVTHSISSYI